MSEVDTNNGSTRISIDGYEPKHLSYSTVDGFRTCGKRFQLQKVERREQRPGLAGIGGNAVHAATEWFDLGSYPAELWKGETFDVVEAFRAAWDEEIEKRREQSPSFKVEDYTVTGRASAEYGGKRNQAWWLDNGPKMVQRWIDWRQNGWQIWETPEGNPAIELELNIVLPDPHGYTGRGASNIPVKMFIDRLMVTPAGVLTVVDIKTGREPETAEQLGLYAVGIEQTWGKMFRPDWGYFWDANKGAHGSPQPLEMYTADYFAEVYASAARGINAGAFLAKPQNRCFNWCSVAHLCPANPNASS